MSSARLRLNYAELESARFRTGCNEICPLGAPNGVFERGLPRLLSLSLSPISSPFEARGISIRNWKPRYSNGRQGWANDGEAVH